MAYNQLLYSKLIKIGPIIPIVIWIVMGMSCAKATTSKQEPITNKATMNVLLIIGESHRADALGVAGNTFIQTPHIDLLAKQGVYFKNAHVTTAICSVSRASILSGQHRARHGINDFVTGFTANSFKQTLPLQLKENGYRLAWIGSYGVGTAPNTEAFDLWAPKIPWNENGLHNTDNITAKATQWIQNYQAKDPFFMQLNFNSAHEIDPTATKPAHYLIQERFKNLYSDITIPTAASSDPAVWKSFPPFFQNEDNIARKRWLGFFSNEELFQKNSKDYYRSLTGVDEAVGKLIAKLKEKNLDQNTIIIYTSDHGFSLGEHGIMGKWNAFKESTHVPLIIYHPQESSLKGLVNENSFALNIDIAPTILGMLKAKIPTGMQGVNLMDMISGKIANRDRFFYEHQVIGSPGLPQSEALITKDYKYIKFIEHNYEILYDLKNDPDEIKNEIDNPQYANVLQDLRKTYLAERQSAR
ncbi:sulfatase-like hydrolase/transferase [Sphingobacterium sp. HJSM2_6]|uniref:sulfatase-like hydrolase/transferase n=1 Tax=Sphingobacterium sp. HJSM2_6 TaxID=3366264 RepID=UPI003BEDF64A